MRKSGATGVELRATGISYKRSATELQHLLTATPLSSSHLSVYVLLPLLRPVLLSTQIHYLIMHILNSYVHT